MGSKKKTGAVAPGIRQRGPNRFEVRYRDPRSRDSRGYAKVRGKSFRTEKEAKDWQARTRIELNEGRFISPDRGRTSWCEVATRYLNMRGDDLANRTQQGYRTILGTWLGDWHHAQPDPTDPTGKRMLAPTDPHDMTRCRRINSLSPDDVEAVIMAMKGAKPKARAAQTQHRVFNLMSATFGYAMNMRYIAIDPTAHMRGHLASVNKNRFFGKALTPTEAMLIINALPVGRFRLYALLAYYSGFRAGELAGLRVRNLDPLRGTVRVGETVEDISGVLQPGTPKTEMSADRVVPISDSVMAQLIDYVAREGLEPDDYVFAGPNEYFSHKNFFNRQWRAACKEAGLVGVRFHDLRVTFGSLRARDGMPPHKLQRLMGHKDINTTMRHYVDVFDGDPEDKKFADRIFELTESGEPISEADVKRLHPSG